VNWTLQADQCDRTFHEPASEEAAMGPSEEAAMEPDRTPEGPASTTYLTDRRRRAIRAGLVVLAIPAAWVAIWALAAPHSFYADFPGAGHEWVAPLGPYDEHLVRDVGAFELALLGLAAFSFVTLDRRLVQGTLGAYLVSGTPHFVYHATATEPLSTADNVLSLAGLALGFAVPIVLLPLTRTRPTEVAR